MGRFKIYLFLKNINHLKERKTQFNPAIQNESNYFHISNFLILIYIHIFFPETFDLIESSVDWLISYKFRENSEVINSLISLLQFIYRIIS